MFLGPSLQKPPLGKQMRHKVIAGFAGCIAFKLALMKILQSSTFLIMLQLI